MFTSSKLKFVIGWTNHAPPPIRAMNSRSISTCCWKVDLAPRYICAMNRRYIMGIYHLTPILLLYSREATTFWTLISVSDGRHWAGLKGVGVSQHSVMIVHLLISQIRILINPSTSFQMDHTYQHWCSNAFVCEIVGALVYYSRLCVLYSTQIYLCISVSCSPYLAN